jgi:transcriptional regulator with XRE-family HTH domain
MKLSEFRQLLHKDTEYIEAEKKLRIKIDIANAILEARLKRNLSQADLAVKVGTKQANISRIEAGISNPTIDLIGRIINALDLEINVSVSEKESLINCPEISIFPSSSENAIVVTDWPGPGNIQTIRTTPISAAGSSGRFYD